MTRKKDKQEATFGQRIGPIDLPTDPKEIDRKRRFARLQAKCLLDFLEEQGKRVDWLVLL